MPRCLSERIIENEDKIQKAVEELSQGKFPSVRAAAKAHDVSHVTLGRRLKGGRSMHEAHEDEQTLTKAEEKALVQWITQMTATGHPVRHAFIREMAQHIERSRHYDDPAEKPAFYPAIGATWVQRFLHRHRELATTISCTIEASRIKETTKEAINMWFDHFSKVIAEYQISSENMYNMDESGFSIGEIKGAQVVVNKTLMAKYLAHPGRQEWVTVVECISADGSSIPPLVIFKGKNVSSSWIPQKALNMKMHFSGSVNGWTNNEIGLYWLKNCFDPDTREKAAGKTRLLLCDGHDSHISSEFVYYCIQNNIYLHLLIPHSSHLLQPLDVGVFGPLKKAISARLDRLLRAGINRLQKVEWLEAYADGREVVVSSDNIKGGFRGAGLDPLNRVRITSSLPAVRMRPKTPDNQINSSPSFDTVIKMGLRPDTKVLRLTNASLRVKACRDELDSPARRYIPHLAEMNEQLLAENAILQRQLNDIEAIVSGRKERKKGKRLVLKGKYGLNSLEVAAQLAECEKATRSKRGLKGESMKNEEVNPVQTVELLSDNEDEDEEAERRTE